MKIAKTMKLTTCEKPSGGKKEEKMTTIATKLVYRFPNIDISIIEDGISDGFLEYLENKKSIKNPIRYITIVAMDSIKSNLRRLQKTVPLNFDIPKTETNQLDKLINNEERNLMKSALKLLPIKQRRFLIQYYDSFNKYGYHRSHSDYVKAIRLRKKLRVILTKMSANSP